MKKHDEGYVLAYVTVVLLVFCLVATTILTGAMKNLEHQQKAIEKTQDQYAAAGMIERILSNWDEAKNMEAETSEEGTITIEKNDDGTYTLTATANMVTIICVVSDNGEYRSYEVGVTEATAPEENGGAAG